MPDVVRPQDLPRRHQVVRDFSHLVEGEPTECVFVEVLTGMAVVRPLGQTAPERRVDLRLVRPVEPPELAPGTCGRPNRQRIGGTSA
ncbi:hypothetical protein OG401_10300 [Kitasatospora purpeofusca]|uniref:hypothetical protein n=1 Tax=Kitasatospora purpeofusca TaxID=67352 RepID=UPI0022590347|nr:hypothetical protein [Kitasatospora purpeofusca]MCX4684695.1 hypothetical protein [Kitasatospora purpeofusca]